MYTEEQLARMEKGLAPQRFNEEVRKWVSKELHKAPPIPQDPSDLNIIEVWADEPSMTDPFQNFRNPHA